MPPARRARLFLLLALPYWLALAGVDVMSDVASPRAQPDTTKDKAVYHVTALRSTLKEIGGEKVLVLIDDVKIIHEDVTVTAQEGFHYHVRRLTRLIDDVEINQGTLTMWGDEGEYQQPADLAILRKNVRVVYKGLEVTCDGASYSRATGRAWLVGNVVARDSTSTLYADSLFYDRETLRAEAFGNVRITNLEEGFTLQGRHGYYYRDRGEGIVDMNPRLIVDPTSAEPVTIDSDTMRIFPDDKHALAYYTVKILKGTTVTQCDSAVLYDDKSRVELYGRPLAKQDDVSMEGEMMALFYDEEEVTRININGNAAIREAQSDTFVIGRENWIKGDTINLHLHNNRVDSIHVLHNATSEYYPANRRKVESNFVRGDNMFFQFERDSLEYVRITGSADGVYKYVDLERGETCDSLRAAADTNLAYLPFRNKAKKVVYSARRIEYYASKKDLVLKDSAKILYQNRVLTGDHITYFSSLQLLDARGGPKLVDAGETFYGERMDYDMEGGSGLVAKGSTQFGEGYYFGDNVAKVGENEMKVWKSTYTTCDLKEPHFHFSAKEMKVFPKDKVVSGPIWLYVGKTPIAYLPFMANSIRRGRRSGILRPEFEFGITKQTGRYVRGFGYYWATNDYTDFTFTGYFNEESSFNVHMQNRYNLRYRFGGNVDFDFYRNLKTFLNEWKLDAKHNHTLGENFTMNSDIHFVSSDKGARAISEVDDVERVIDRTLRSTLNVSKRWSTVGLSASASRTQKLNVEDPNVTRVEATFPSIALSIPSQDLYFGEKSKPGQAPFIERFLSGIGYSPRLSGSRRTEEREFQYKEVITSNQSVNIYSPQRIKFLTVSPTLSASNAYTRIVNEVISHEVTDPGDTTTTFIPWTRAVEEDNVFSWNTGANASTKLYGTFYPEIGRLRGVRHTIAPSTSYRFTPEIGNRPSSQSFGVKLTNTLDLKIARRVREEDNRTDAGRVGRGEEMKGTGSPRADTTSAREEQVDKLSGVVVWTLSSSYNPKAPKNAGWSNVSSNVNLNLFGTSISMNQTIDPYERKLLSTSINTGLTLRGTHPFGKTEAIETEELNVVAAADTSERREEAPDETPGRKDSAREQVTEGLLPWSLDMRMSYNNWSGRDPQATVNMSGNIDLTPAWKISYRTSYDVEAREFSF
jgi:lipopolysaccharide export system protein LptA